MTRDSEISGYGYDANGNRLTATDASGARTATYDAQDRLLTDGERTFEYTPQGQLSTRTDGTAVTSFSYDDFGALRSVSLPNGTDIDYVVDPMGRRIGKRVNGALVQGFLYRNALNVVAELDGDGDVVSRFVYATQSHVPDFMFRDGSVYRFITDERGSVRLVVDAASGEVVQRLDYDPWGNVLQDTNPGLQPFGYAGGLYDADTGLVRFGARDYDPETGRWVSKDPVRWGGGLNFYVYVGDDPVNLLDPLGLRRWSNEEVEEMDDPCRSA